MQILLGYHKQFHVFEVFCVTEHNSEKKKQCVFMKVLEMMFG